jgi:hypothetical protein
MAYEMSGTYFENCSCDVICPCITSPTLGPADADHCHAILAFNVESGQIDGLDVSGRTAVLFVNSPPMMSDGNWKVGLIVDDGAAAEQTEALAAVFTGQLGGPMAGFAPLFGEVLGVENHPVTFQEDGGNHRLQIGDQVSIEIDEYTPEGFDEPMTLTNAPHPANSTLTIAKASTARVTAFGFDWDQPGTNGQAAPFSWSA